MKRVSKLFLVFSLLALLLLTFTTPASAFDGRSGDNIVVNSDEVINDDLYITAGTFVLDGTVNGDLIAIGQTLTINGRVDGDVLAAGQTVVVNGTVTGAVRMAGSVLLLGEGASVGGDVIAAGYSLESQEGSGVGQDLLFAGSQILLTGDVARHAHVSANAFELRGAVGAALVQELEKRMQAMPVLHQPCSCLHPRSLSQPWIRVSPLPNQRGSKETCRIRNSQSLPSRRVWSQVK